MQPIYGIYKAIIRPLYCLYTAILRPLYAFIRLLYSKWISGKLLPQKTQNNYTYKILWHKCNTIHFPDSPARICLPKDCEKYICCNQTLNDWRLAYQPTSAEIDFLYEGHIMALQRSYNGPPSRAYIYRLCSVDQERSCSSTNPSLDGGNTAEDELYEGSGC